MGFSTGEPLTTEKPLFPHRQLRPRRQQPAPGRDRLRLRPAGRRPSPPRQRWTGMAAQPRFQPKRTPIKRARRPRSSRLRQFRSKPLHSGPAPARRRARPLRRPRHPHPAPPRRPVLPCIRISKTAAPLLPTRHPRFQTRWRRVRAKPAIRSQVHDRFRPTRRITPPRPAIPRRLKTRKRPVPAHRHRFRPGPIATG